MISIIIVGYNSKRYLDDCLSSIFKSAYKNFKVIFVDNNSEDDSIEYIEKYFPKVSIIRSKKNLGFAGGNNLGIKKAIKDNYEYVFLINPDTIIDSKCIANLTKKADKETILQPLVLLYENGKKTDLINTTGGILHYLGFSYCSNYRQHKSVAKEKDIAIGSGAGIFIPTKILNKIGLFDEDFFMYHEDVDLMWRARLYGFNIRLIPKAVLWHKYSVSRNNNKLYFVEKNRILFILKNFSFKFLLLFFIIFFINEFFMILYSIIGGWLTKKIKSYFQICKNFVFIIKKRKVIQKKRIISDRDLFKYLDSEINFEEVKFPFMNIYNKVLVFYKLIFSRLV